MFTVQKYTIGIVVFLSVWFFVQPLTAQAAIPQVFLTANPTTIELGDSAKISWIGVNGVVACSFPAPNATGTFPINTDPIGNIVVSPIVTTTYGILCTTSTAFVDAIVTIVVTPPAPPSVTLSASSASITKGSSVTLTWSSNNVVTSCVADSTDGLFSGTKGKSGSVSISPPNTATYSITCVDKSDASASSLVVVNVSSPPPIPPSVTLSASDTLLTRGESSTLKWTSNAVVTTCSISSTDFSLSGTKPTNGTQVVTPLSNTTYQMICEDASGATAQSSVAITVNDPPIVPDPPQITSFRANALSILVGQSSDLLWTTNSVVTSCVASSTDGSFSGPKSANGTENVSPVSTTTFTLTCSDASDATVTASLVINVSSPPPLAPTVTLEAGSRTIVVGNSTTLKWVTNASVVDCVAGSTDGSFDGVKATNGTESVSPVSTTTFTITCENASGITATASVVVNVSNVPPPPASCNNNGTQDPGEACDDPLGNGSCPKTCSTNCTLNNCGPGPAFCGDTWLDIGEECDDGPANGACPARCSASCTENDCSVLDPPSMPSSDIVIKNPLAFNTVEDLLNSILAAIQAIVAILSLIMIVIGSIIYMTAAGNEGKLGTGKMIITAAIVGLALALAAPSFLKEIGTVLGWGEVAPGPAADAKGILQIITGVLNFLLSIVGIIGVIMLVIGGIMYLTAAGDQKKVETGKKIVVYSIIGIAVASAALVLVAQVVRFFS